MVTLANLPGANLDMPALAPPPGVVPNFIDPPTNRTAIFGVFVTCLVIMTLAVAIRMYTKIFMLKKLAVEDYLVISAFLSYAVGWNCISFIMMNMKGAGTHQWDVYIRDLIPFLYYLLVAYTLYGIVVVQLKVAIIIQCLRVMVPSGVRNGVYWILHGLLWTHVIFYVGCTFVEIFMCTPRHKAWDPTVKTGHCMDSNAVNIAAAAINTVSDLVLVLIPQTIIWRLNMPSRRKWVISLCFLFGLLASISAAVRMYYSIELSKVKDFTWGATQMGLWVSVEICCGFLVACIPVFPRFFGHVGAGLRLLLRLKQTDSAKLDLESAGSDEIKPRKHAIITDREFQELVKQTELSMVITVCSGPERRDPECWR